MRSHKVAQETCGDFGIFEAFNPLDTEEIADRIHSVVRVSDASVGMPYEKVAITSQFTMIDRLMIGKPDFEPATALVRWKNGAVFRFRLTRLVKLDRETQAHHLFAKINPLRLGISSSDKTFSATLQIIRR